MIIGTRGSLLALKQARIVSKKLMEYNIKTKEKIITTKGDIITDKPISSISYGYGAFSKELDESLYKKDIDIAVHSMKDIPSISSKENIIISSVLKRDSPYDIIISNNGFSIDDFPKNSIIGTSSVRRRAQILRKRPDLKIKNLRGNIDTRLNKLKSGLYDGIILSEAGLQRLNLVNNLHNNIKRLDLLDFCPSPNQGTIAIMTLESNKYFIKEIAPILNDEQTYLETMIERRIMKSLNIGCSMPVGIYAKYSNCNKYINITVDILSFNGEDSIIFNEKVNVNDNINNEVDKIINKIYNSKAKNILLL